uniref:Uncharacterized protein n=1 Tax=Ditylenchus dipsaci TaxID=166011 RepID=A0A915D6A1_9BILA
MKFKPHDVNRSHNHAEDPMAVPLSVMKANMKKINVDTREAPKQLLNNELQSMHLALAPSVTDSAVRKMVRRRRIQNEIPNPSFQSHIRWSEEIDVVFGDGTFDPTPKPFTKVIFQPNELRVSTTAENRVFPVLYALLRNKSRQTYKKLFRMIRELWPAFKLSSFNVDFELAAIQALNEVFPEPDRLLQDLKRIQRTHDMHYEQHLARQTAPKKRRAYFECDARILTKVHRYNFANLIPYLRGLAYNFIMDQ